MFKTTDRRWLTLSSGGQALGGIGTIGTAPTIPILADPDEPAEPADRTLTAKQKRRAKGQSQADELKRWVKAVGHERAAAAWLARNQLARARGGNKPTLIECLTESFLMRRGVAYEAQVWMGIARPDFVVFDTRTSSDGGAVVWNINGEYWHRPRVWHDEGKGSALINIRVRDVPIRDVIAIWEDDIMRGDQVFEDALRGERYRN